MANLITQEIVINPNQQSPQVQLIKSKLFKTFNTFFFSAAIGAASAAERVVDTFHKELTDDDRHKLELVVLAAYGAIKWNELVKLIEEDFQALAEAGVKEGMNQLSSTSKNLEENSYNFAVDLAKKRAAEIVGKKYDDGTLKYDPTAKWNVAETTREDLGDLVENLFVLEGNLDKIHDEILNSSIFSVERSELITNFESDFLHTQSNLQTWAFSGIVHKVEVILSPEHVIEDECDEIVGRNPHDVHSLPIIPIHPRCKCSIKVVEIIQ